MNSPDKKLITQYNEVFFDTFKELKKPTIAIITNEEIKIICLNHLLDYENNRNTIKLTKFSKNSPGLFELSVVLGFISLFLNESRREAEHQIKMAILEEELETAKINKSLALRNFLKEQNKTIDKNKVDIDLIVDVYKEFLDRDETNMIFNIDNPYIERNLLDLKKQAMQEAVDFIFDGEVKFDEIFEVNIYG